MIQKIFISFFNKKTI